MSFILIQILILGILILLSAFFSGSETALFSLSKIRVKRLQLENCTNSKLVAHLLDKPTRLLISILIGNMLVNVLASSVASVLITRIVGDKGLGISIGVMTFFILIFGEITPKSIAINNSEKFSLKVVPYINIFSKIVFPVRKLLRFITDFFVKQFARSFKLKKDRIGLTEGELKKAINLGRNEGVFDVGEEKMFKGVFEFRNKRTSEIMRPRKEIISFDVNTPLNKIKSVIAKEELARIPVYVKALDNILGILYAKDLIIACRKGEVDIKEILRKPFYVTKDIRLDKLLTELRTKRIHMALVKDSGKLVGLVTLEDLLEEIVGEIRDIRESRP